MCMHGCLLLVEGLEVRGSGFSPRLHVLLRSGGADRLLSKQGWQTMRMTRGHVPS
jgi:hypothetical protein